MKKIFYILAGLLMFAGVALAQFDDPFGVEARLDGDVIRLEVSVPTNYYLYASHFEVTDAAGHEQAPLEVPPTTSIVDPETGKIKAVYDHPFTATYSWKPAADGVAAFHVKYSGCNDEVCFIPQDKVVELAHSGSVPEVGKADGKVSSDWKTELEHFRVVESQAGYLKAGEFIDFMDRVEHGSGEELSGIRLFFADPVAFVRESGLLLTLFIILGGGLLLNLTPCVLPMIPINLAIIGAGAQAGSKRRGFALGAAYGLGIALSYGLLGAIIVMTGSRFGTIQSNPWFNLVIALIFVALALAMFDVFQIDFSRFQSKLGGGQKQGSFAVAITMGAVSALLAGACVAPVVIAVLLLATSLGTLGLILPFVLGFGMALPWPFAGAGLSFLPKPGKWMEYVKYAFGVGIILFAVYYGHLSYRAFRPAEVVTGGGEAAGHFVVDGATNIGLADALQQARAEGKPVFIDFWASWCKNCHAMEKSTFKDAAVKARLEKYLFIKYVSEDPVNPETKAVMDRFNVQGLPTFVVLDEKE